METLNVKFNHDWTQLKGSHLTDVVGSSLLIAMKRFLNFVNIDCLIAGLIYNEINEIPQFSRVRNIWP